MITDILIRNFRGLKNLRLAGLRSVNLIVGTNNAGKTSLLEALAAAADPRKLDDLPQTFRGNGGKIPASYFKWMVADGEEASLIQLTLEGKPRKQLEIQNTRRKVGAPGMTESQKGSTFVYYQEGDQKLRCSSVAVQHRSPESIIPSFADTVRSPANERILEELLMKIDPRIRSARLDVLGKEQLIAIDIGLSERVPLSQVGQGVYRTVSILSDILGSKPDLFIVDEIENGIHWTALPTLWKGLAEVAASLGIQIFATTHSRECLAAAQEVFLERNGAECEEFAVIQLMRVGTDINGRVLSGKHVEAAIENDIELR